MAHHFTDTWLYNNANNYAANLSADIVHRHAAMGWYIQIEIQIDIDTAMDMDMDIDIKWCFKLNNLWTKSLTYKICGWNLNL